MMQLSLGKIVFVSALAVGVSLAIACGSSHPPNGTIGNVNDDPTACSEEGAVIGCHVNLGTKNGVTNCSVGAQSCTNGHWTACSTSGGVKGASYGGSFTSAGYHPTGLPAVGGSGGLHILADPVDASADAGLCQDDPCDPYCFGWDDEAAAPPPAPPPPASGGNPTGLPPGWQAAGTVNPCAVPGGAQDCQYDQCCPAAGGSCTLWAGAPVTGDCAPLTNNLAATCATKPDFTAQVGCDDPVSNDSIISVCNRGGVAATAGQLYIAMRDDKYTPGPANFPFVTGKGYCTADLGPAGINGGIGLPPGACFPVDISKPQTGVKCFGIKIEKQNSIFINGGDGSGSAQDATHLSLPECTGANNWTAMNHQKCAAAVAGGGAGVFTCVDPSQTPFYQTRNPGNPCHPGNGLGQCDFDECCYKNGANNCRLWSSVNSGDCDNQANGCTNKPNFTVGGGCKDANGEMHLPICNRGDADVTSGQFYMAFSFQPMDTYPMFDLQGCQWDWTTIGGLGSGGCVDFNVTQAQVDGNPVICDPLVTGNIGAVTVAVRVNNASGLSGTNVSSGPNNNGIPECGGADNWSISNSGIACTGCPSAPTGDGGGSYTYTATCPSGSRVQWKNLVYDVSNGEVEFNATTTTTLIDGSVAPTSNSYQLADPPNSPLLSACHWLPAAGGCPVDLYAKLGPIDSHGEVMGLDIVPHGAANVIGWSVSYDCIPYE